MKKKTKWILLVLTMLNILLSTACGRNAICTDVAAPQENQAQGIQLRTDAANTEAVNVTASGTEEHTVRKDTVRRNPFSYPDTAAESAR